MLEHDFDDVPGALNLAEERFVSRRLAPSLRFLRDVRVPGEAWPRYRGLPSDLAASAITIQALQLVGDESADIIVADAAAFVRSAFGSSRPGRAADVVQLVFATSAEKWPDSSYRDALWERLDGCIPSDGAGFGRISTAVLADAALAAQIADGPAALAGRFEQALLNRQNPQFGGWGLREGGEGSVASTARAVRVLARTTVAGADDAVGAGLHFLSERLVDASWPEVCLANPYTAAWVIRALAVRQSYGEQTLEGVQYLRSLQHADGGWGGGGEGVSSIEATAMCVIALLEHGDCRYVPLRVAQELVGRLRAYTASVVEERNRLGDNFQGQVEEHCGRVIVERDRLVEELRVAKGLLADLQKANSASVARQEALDAQLSDLALRASRWQRIALGRPRESRPGGYEGMLLAAFCLFVAAAYALGASWSAMTKVALLSFGGIALVVGVTLRLRYAQREYLDRGRAFRAGSAEGGARRIDSDFLPDLVDFFRFATEEYPPGVREEVVYRLLREGVDLPRDIGRRFVAELLLDMDIPIRFSGRLEEWLDRVMLLDPVERRHLIMLIRRAVL